MADEQGFPYLKVSVYQHEWKQAQERIAALERELDEERNGTQRWRGYTRRELEQQLDGLMAQVTAERDAARLQVDMLREALEKVRAAGVGTQPGVISEHEIYDCPKCEAHVEAAERALSSTNGTGLLEAVRELLRAVKPLRTAPAEACNSFSVPDPFTKVFISDSEWAALWRAFDALSEQGVRA